MSKAGRRGRWHAGLPPRCPADSGLWVHGRRPSSKASGAPPFMSSGDAPVSLLSAVNGANTRGQGASSVFWTWAPEWRVMASRWEGILQGGEPRARAAGQPREKHQDGGRGPL